MRCPLRTRHIFAALLLALIAGPVVADTITLKSGRTIEGRIVSEKPGEVRVDAGGIVLTLPRDQIASIAASAPTPATAASTETVNLRPLENLETQGKWIELYETADALLKKHPDNAQVRHKLETAQDRILTDYYEAERVKQLVLQRKFDPAIDLLREQLRKSGLAARPAGAVGRRALADVHLARAEHALRKTNDGTSALSDVRQARELAPGAPRLDAIAGWAQMTLRNFDEATRLLRRAADQNPDDFQIRLLLLQCYDEMNDSRQIVELCESDPEKAMTTAKRWPEFRDIIAAAYQDYAIRLADAGTTPQACALYDRYLEFTDRNSEQMHTAMQFFERVGDEARAGAARDEWFGRTKPATAEPGEESPDLPKAEWLK